MSRLRSWPLVSRERLQDCRVFRLDRVVARSPSSGREHDFFCLESADWVNVVPVTAEEELVMVRQYRHGSSSMTLEIPGGLVDPGESPAAAAARELLEETGYRAPQVVGVGGVNPNPALFGNRVHTFLADGAERMAGIRNEGAEETEVVLVPVSEVGDRARAGDFDSALVLAGLYHWELWRREVRT